MTATKDKPVRLVLAEDHTFVRELTAMFLAKEARYQIVAEADTAHAAIEACERLCPDVLLLDINLPGMSGIEALPQLTRVVPQTKVLICSGSCDERQIVEALRAGPSGFIEKTSCRQTFLEALARVADGGVYHCPRSARLLKEMAQGLHPAQPVGKSSGLTEREQEVARLIARGQSTKEVASQLNLSEGTAATHRANLMRKLGLRNAAELTQHVMQKRLFNEQANGW